MNLTFIRLYKKCASVFLPTLARTSGETSSSVDHSFPFLFPTVCRCKNQLHFYSLSITYLYLYIHIHIHTQYPFWQSFCVWENWIGFNFLYCGNQQKKTGFMCNVFALVCSLLFTHPIIHEQVLHNEVSHDGFHWWSKLIWGQHGNVTEGHQWCDKLLRHVCVQTTWQRLRLKREKTWVQSKTRGDAPLKLLVKWSPTSKICASCTSLLLKMAWMQWTACLAWWGVPRLAFWCRMGIRVLTNIEEEI